MNPGSLFSAYRYCERLTAHHYENFPVASWLLPSRMRPHVAAIYAFARAADDFADEARYQGRSLELLGRWRKALWNGSDHPIFIALADTIRRYDLPVQWLDDLLTAFSMDVTQRRYADWAELMAYCRYSANPVGRLVLALFGSQDPELQRLSDCICSGLQLANHWQDLRIDWSRDMLYVPQDLLKQFGVTEDDLRHFSAAGPTACGYSRRPSSAFGLRARRRGLPPASPAARENFRRLMAELVNRARALFDEGEPLVRHLRGGLRLEIQLTVMGGRAILDRIEAADYDVFRHRPSLSTLDKIGLLFRGQGSCRRAAPSSRARTSLAPFPKQTQVDGCSRTARAAEGICPAPPLAWGRTASPVLREAFRYCRWLTGQAGSHFSLSFALLPNPRRRGMEVIYAYCRAIDDVVDQGDLTDAEARAQLEFWRRELLACERGTPTHPIGIALQWARRQFDIPRVYFERLILGVEMDLRPRRYRTFEELKTYCEHVASAVGMMSVRVFGCRHPASDRTAHDLGLAFQLTNILRDLKADAQQGRVYLPAEDLERFGCKESQLLEGKVDRPMEELLAFECARAWSYFRQAEEYGRESGEAGALLPARIMSAVYQRILQRIEERKYDVFSERIRIPRWEQLGIVLPFVLNGK